MAILGKDHSRLEWLKHAAGRYLDTLTCLAALDAEPALLAAEATILGKVAVVHAGMDDLSGLTGHLDVLVGAIYRIGPDGIAADVRGNLLIVLQRLGN